MKLMSKFTIFLPFFSVLPRQRRCYFHDCLCEWVFVCLEDCANATVWIFLKKIRRWVLIQLITVWLQINNLHIYLLLYSPSIPVYKSSSFKLIFVIWIFNQTISVYMVPCKWLTILKKWFVYEVNPRKFVCYNCWTIFTENCNILHMCSTHSDLWLY